MFDLWPFIFEHAINDRIAEGAILAFDMPQQHTFPLGAELGDGGLRAHVQRVGLNLDPAVPAVLEAVGQQQQFGLGIDLGAPPA